MRTREFFMGLLLVAACTKPAPVKVESAPVAGAAPATALTKILESNGEVHIGGRFGTTGSIVVDGDWLETMAKASAVTQARGVMTMQVFADTRTLLWTPGENPWVRVDRGRVLAYVYPGVQAHFFGRGITATTDKSNAAIVYFDTELLDPYVSWYEGSGGVSNGVVTQPTGTGYAAAFTYEATDRRFYPARRDFYQPADAERVRRLAHENEVR